MVRRSQPTVTARRAIAWALVAAVLIAAPRAALIAAPRHVDLELILAVDVSESVDKDEARLQRDGYIAAITDPRVIAAIRSGVFGRIAVAYVEWSGTAEQRPVAGWTLIDGAAGAHAFAAALSRVPIGTGRWTSISGAIDFAVPMFEANGYEGTRRVIDVSGDGNNNHGRPVTLARDAAVARGITINGLPVIHKRFNFSWPPMPYLDVYFRRCVIGGPGAFMVVAANMADFAASVRRKLIREIAGLAAPAGSGPWQPASGEDYARCETGEQPVTGIGTEPAAVARAASSLGAGHGSATRARR